MTIQIKSGDLLNTTAKLIAHQVNCRGVMGAGVAKAIKLHYPYAYYAYKELCVISDYDATKLLGTVSFTPVDSGDKIIANMFGQDGFGTDRVQTSYPALDSCFDVLLRYASVGGFQRIAFPFKVGCGLAGGNWSEVVEMLIAKSKPTPIIVELWQLNPDPNIFGSAASITVDRVEDGILTGEYGDVRFTAPASLFGDCKSGDVLNYSLCTGQWHIDEKKTAERQSTVNSLWNKLNFQ